MRRLDEAAQVLLAMWTQEEVVIVAQRASWVIHHLAACTIWKMMLPLGGCERKAQGGQDDFVDDFSYQFGSSLGEFCGKLCLADRFKKRPHRPLPKSVGKW